MSNSFEQSFGVKNLLGGSSNIAFFGVGAMLSILVIAASYLVINKSNKKVKSSSSSSSSWQQELVASKQKSSLSESDDAQADTTTTTSREDDDMVVDDVWEQRRRRGITMPKSSISTNASSSTTSKTSSSQGKPFGSSYYYAHNHLRAKGGYTDGLEPEDYTMNGPRLLSRNGQAVEKRKNNNKNTSGGVDSINTAQTIKGENTSEQQQQQLPQQPKNVKVRRILNISKYMWDDPGDGTACIRIDQLPVSGSDSTTVNWGDVKVKNVTATLEGEGEGGNGLMVLVETEEQVDYQLRIPQLYGKVSQVKTIIVKPKKRLLVKLQKKVGLFDKSNAKAWPHPQKKKIL